MLRKLLPGGLDKSHKKYSKQSGIWGMRNRDGNGAKVLIYCHPSKQASIWPGRLRAPVKPAASLRQSLFG